MPSQDVGPDDWFRTALRSFYTRMFQPDRPFYLPKVIREGADIAQFGLHVPPLNGLYLPDIRDLNVEEPLTGACGLNLCEGGGHFSSEEAALARLDSALPAGQGLVFLAEDNSQFRLALTLSELAVRGNVVLTQACKSLKGQPLGHKEFAGTYSMTITSVTLTLPITLNFQNDSLSLAIGSIETAFVDNKPFKLKLELPNTPQRLITDWEQKVNKPRLVQDRLRALVTDALAGRAVSGWLESYLNPFLDQIWRLS